MRDRLIEKISIMEEMIVDPKANFKITDVQRILRQAREMLEKAIIPPCKVGDKVYYLCGKKVFNLTIEKIVIKESGMFLVDKSFNDWYSVEEIGKTLYLSKEEAEAKLKGGAE